MLFWSCNSIFKTISFLTAVAISATFLYHYHQLRNFEWIIPASLQKSNDRRVLSIPEIEGTLGWKKPQLDGANDNKEALAPQLTKEQQLQRLKEQAEFNAKVAKAQAQALAPKLAKEQQLQRLEDLADRAVAEQAEFNAKVDEGLNLDSHVESAIEASDSVSVPLEAMESHGLEESNNEQLLWGLRVLYFINMYNYKQYSHTELMIDSIRDMCEAGAKVSLVLQTTVEIPEPMLKAFEQRQYCVNIEGSFTFQIEKHDPDVKHLLSQKHRAVMYDNLDDFDLFIYSEDDMHIRPTHVTSFLSETNLLEKHFPDMFDKDYEGQRYMISNVRWESAYTIQDLKEEKPDGKKVQQLQGVEPSSRLYWENSMYQYKIEEIKPGLGPYVSTKTPHTAMWMVTKKQAVALKQICNFDNPECPYEHCALRLWVSMNHFIYEKVGCGVKRVIPLGLFDAFAVHHLPDQNWRRKAFGNTKTNEEVANSYLVGNKQLMDILWNNAQNHGIRPRTL